MQNQTALKDDRRLKLLEANIRLHQFKPDTLIEILTSAQELYGYLSKEVLEYIANLLHLPLSRVYGVATFYNLYRISEVGKHIVSVCMGTACYVKGAEELLSAVEEEFKVKRGKTSDEHSLSLFVTRCIGVCALAPNAVIDGELMSKVVKDSLIKRIKSKLEEEQQ